MKDSFENRLQHAEAAELARGYRRRHACLYECLFCETQSLDEAAARRHLHDKHESPLVALLALPKPFTGLTDRQKTLIAGWYGGQTDAQLAGDSGSSVSTIRNVRFALREHARQARLFLAVMALAGIEEEPRMTAKKDSIDHFFQEGRLLQIPARHQKREQVMRRISEAFEPGREYSDRQVREILENIHEDYAQIRRYLVDQQLLHRTPDGRTYWRDDHPQKEEKPMPIDKKAAKAAYKNSVTPMGVYRILDRETGRFILDGDRNLNGAQSRFQFMMFTGGIQSGGTYSDPQLFEDYRDHPDAFVFEVVARVDTDKYPSYEEASAQLKRLLEEQQALYPMENRYVTK